MAIGMKMGRTDPKDKKTILKAYEMCRQFWDEFEREFGSTHCYDLTGGYHLDNEEERQKWLASGGIEKCAALVEKTAGMLSGLLNRAE